MFPYLVNNKQKVSVYSNNLIIGLINELQMNFIMHSERGNWTCNEPILQIFEISTKITVIHINVHKNQENS